MDDGIVEQHRTLKEDMEYSVEYKKCKHDVVYFVEHYVTVNGKNIVLTQLQKSLLRKLMRKKQMKLKLIPIKNELPIPCNF